jgi:hypothetical protein
MRTNGNYNRASEFSKVRKLHEEELRDLYSFPSIIRIIKSRRMRWDGHVARMGWRGTLINYWWESPTDRLLGRPRRRWVDNIRMDLGEVGRGNVDWIGLAKGGNRWGALVDSVLNLRVPWNAGKLSSGLASSGLSSSAQLHGVSYKNIKISKNYYFYFFNKDV